MSDVTFVPEGQDSCAGVQSCTGVPSVAERIVDGEITVVVMCSRCPAETPLTEEGEATRNRASWSVVLVDDGRGVAHKVLCTDCRRDLARWFLTSTERG